MKSPQESIINIFIKPLELEELIKESRNIETDLNKTLN